MELPTPPNPTPPSSSWWVYVLGSLAVIAVSILGGVGRLLHDKHAKDDDSEPQPITGRDWAYYITLALLAGIVIGVVVVWKYGFSILLIGVAGVAGFGSAQLLGLCVQILSNIIKKLSYPNGSSTVE